MAQAELALHRLRHEQAAVGKPLRRRRFGRQRPGRRRFGGGCGFLVLAVILVAVGDGRPAASPNSAAVTTAARFIRDIDFIP
jgi:hypothetical protein